MSTRCQFVVEDEHTVITVYRHSCGEPEMVIKDLNEALQLSWNLPRFEADEFSASIVSAMKQHEGGIRIMGGGNNSPTPFDWEPLLAGDIEFLYHIWFRKPINTPVVDVYGMEAMTGREKIGQLLLGEPWSKKRKRGKLVRQK